MEFQYVDHEIRRTTMGQLHKVVGDSSSFCCDTGTMIIKFHVAVNHDPKIIIRGNIWILAAIQSIYKWTRASPCRLPAVFTHTSKFEGSSVAHHPQIIRSTVGNTRPPVARIRKLSPRTGFEPATLSSTDTALIHCAMTTRGKRRQ